MCGIAGMLHFDGSSVAHDAVEAMTDALAHRGPDGEGHYLNGQIGLGHRRLSIIDLSPAAKEPIANEDRSLWLTYNGEIYNFKDLTRELKTLGHTFCSATDAEVVLHAYEEWGTECLARLNGMFAFALWDEKKQTLWLVRDRLGVKPLFYCLRPRAIVFGSEIKAVLAASNDSYTVDLQALSYFLALNYTPAPHTLFSNIRQILPGHYLLVSREGGVRNVQYWDVQFDEGRRLEETEYIEQFRALLEDSVRIRLVSDVPFGVFLSGGLDSSAVAFWMSRHLNEPLRAYSVGFDTPGFDELRYARLVARHVGAEHHERRLSEDDCELLPRLVWHAEEPTADSSMVAVFQLAQFAREQVAMVLTGDGADEILAGYDTYAASYATRLYRVLPRWLRQQVIRNLVQALPVRHGKVTWEEKLRRFVAGADLAPEDAHATWRMIFPADERRQLLAPVEHCPGAGADAIDLYRAAFGLTDARHWLNRLLYADTTLYLPNDMLVKLDRMTMAHGLEAREPMLDHRLVEFAARVPPALKLRRLRRKKYLLKAAMRDLLPAAVIQRRKEGFNVPNARWLSGALRPFVMDHLSPHRVRDLGLLDTNAVARILDDHWKEKADRSHQIWCLLTLVLWWQRFKTRLVIP